MKKIADALFTRLFLLEILFAAIFVVVYSFLGQPFSAWLKYPMVFSVLVFAIMDVLRILAVRYSSAVAVRRIIGITFFLALMFFGGGAILMFWEVPNAVAVASNSIMILYFIFRIAREANRYYNKVGDYDFIWRNILGGSG